MLGGDLFIHHFVEAQVEHVAVVLRELLFHDLLFQGFFHVVFVQGEGKIFFLCFFDLFDFFGLFVGFIQFQGCKGRVRLGIQLQVRHIGDHRGSFVEVVF